ncbi:MAG: phosphoglycerate dehydrogenase [Cyclobacteriaceae bacterium]|nr:phosphoglycerate dehydrogenase [Cyclobacteriaceae bacterium HetDA_MAG_MS6]
MKILIADKMHPSIQSMLTDRGASFDYLPEIDRKGILERIGEYDGLIIRSKTKVDEELLKHALKIRFIARAGAGIDQVSEEVLQSRNIQLLNAPEGNRDAVGEHTLGMLLSLCHKLNQGDRQVKSRKWDREDNRGFELKGKTVGIYGYGFMGSAFAEKLQGLSCRVIAYDKYKKSFGGDVVEEVSLKTIQREADIISLHIPLQEDTRWLFDDSFMASFAKLKVLLNTSRGEVLRLSALITLLENGQLIGAGLDVLENEKLTALNEVQHRDFERLIKMQNVLLTPHVAGWTHESYDRINQVIVEKLEALEFFS